MRKIYNMFLAFSAVFFTSAIAFAQTEGAAPGQWFGPKVAIAFGIGIAAYGGTTGQSRAAAAALEGIARNPNAADKIFVPMILSLAFIESLVILAWLMFFL